MTAMAEVRDISERVKDGCQPHLLLRYMAESSSIYQSILHNRDTRAVRKLKSVFSPALHSVYYAADN